jgi:hypothetical protein
MSNIKVQMPNQIQISNEMPKSLDPEGSLRSWILESRFEL